MLVGVFLIYYGLVELFFSFVNEHLDEPEEMVSFMPSKNGFINEIISVFLVPLVGILT